MVASAPPAQAETPFDLSAAINACPVGGTVTVPAGTFTVTSTLTPKSGITIQGSGADTVIYRPDPHSGDPTIITIMDKSNITIKNLTLASNDSGVTSTMRGMELGGATNITIDGVMLRGLSNGIVASDNGDKDNSNLTITRCSSVDVYQPMFIRTTHNSTFSYLDLHAMEDGTQVKSWTPPHHIYICNNSDNLTFDHVTLRGGVDYCIQVYPGPNITDVSFTNLVMDNVRLGPIIWGEDGAISNITFDGVTAWSSRYYHPSGAARQWFRISGGASNVVVRNFAITADGNSYLANYNGTGAGCVLENGTITGSNLPSGIKVSGTAPTVVNVKVNDTPTTVAPTTTTTPTTVAPTTTSTTRTTVAPTTTSTTRTTVAPTTTSTTRTTVAPTTTTWQSYWQSVFNRWR